MKKVTSKQFESAVKTVIGNDRKLADLFVSCFKGGTKCQSKK